MSARLLQTFVILMAALILASCGSGALVCGGTGAYIEASVSDYGNELVEREREPLPTPRPVSRIWHQERFTNDNPVWVPSNNRLAMDLQDLHDNLLNQTENSFPSELWGSWQGADLPVFGEQDYEFDREIRRVLQEGFANDSMSSALPFNQDYWDLVTDEIVYHVWRVARRDPAMAVWSIPIGFGHGMHIFMGTEQSRRREPQDMLFANLVFHELANILGLGDPISELFSEELTGRPSIWGPQYSMRHDPTFMRALYETIGPVEFWRAAFTSDGEVAFLWDTHFGGQIPASHLQMAWGVEETFIWDRRIRDRFVRETGIRDRNRLSISTWFINSQNPELSEDVRQRYLRRVQCYLAAMYEWGSRNRFNPYPFVHDERNGWRERILRFGL